MPATTYRFEHEWLLPADPERVYDVLVAVEGYDRWWPQIRRISRVDDESGWAHVRSALPYTLRLLLRRQVEDRAAGRLRVGVAGDLAGWCAFDVEPSAPGAAATSPTLVRFTQEVEVAAPWLRRLSAVGRPVLVANHAWMLRSGGRGLSRLLTAEPG